MQNINLKHDGHVHTRLCNHATGEMEEYVQAGIAKGLQSITFLEHMESGIQYFERTWLTDNDFELYFKEGNRLKDQYKGSIHILLGVEAGYNPSQIDQLKNRLKKYTWDRIGLSYHFFFDGEKHINMVSRRQENLDALAAIGPEKVLTGYFDGLISAVQQLDCHMLPHLDAGMRHYQGLKLLPSHLEQIDVLLQLMRTKGIALEINTSGYALRNTPFPSYQIVHRALELGIVLVAGSDAHRPDQVGRYFDRLPEFISGR